MTVIYEHDEAKEYYFDITRHIIGKSHAAHASGQYGVVSSRLRQLAHYLDAFARMTATTSVGVGEAIAVIRRRRPER